MRLQGDSAEANARSIFPEYDLGDSGANECGGL
jgi:hypothetical protein